MKMMRVSQFVEIGKRSYLYTLGLARWLIHFLLQILWVILVEGGHDRTVKRSHQVM